MKQNTKSRKGFSKAVSFMLTLALFLSSVNVAFAAVSFTEDDLKPYFPDDIFRQIVFDAIKDDADVIAAESSGTLDAIRAYSGDIKAKAKGIVNAQGLQYLVRADTVDLSKNKIEEWGFLSIAAITGDPVDTAADSWKKYYGYEFEQGMWRNVTWKIGGNPLRDVPSNFGGRLIIEQLAYTSSDYDEDSFRPRVFVRDTAEMDISGVFNITRCKVDGGEYVKVNGITIPPAFPSLLTIGAFTSTSAAFSHLKKSGTQVIGVGIDQEIHFSTEDEWTTDTPGSDSFKYYIHPISYVYDSVSLDHNSAVELTKFDDADPAQPLAGAKFELYSKDNGLKIGDFISDASGKVRVESLTPGAYYFKEISAPAGHVMDGQDIVFTIANKAIEVGGGLSKVQTTKDVVDSNGYYAITDGALEEATPGSVFVAGPLNASTAAISPDITLSALVALDGTTKVKVTYERLETNATTGAFQEKVIREFASVADAAADINREKNANRILGPVVVEQVASVEHVNKKIQTPPSPPSGNKTHSSPSTVSIAGEKVWEDNGNSLNLRPDTVTVELYRNNEAAPIEKKEISAANGWKYSFNSLPKKQADGSLNAYRVKEAAVPEGYYSKVSQDGSKITNTLEAMTTSLRVDKKWVDNPNRDVRPKELKVNLFRNDNLNIPFKTAVLTAETGWACVFEGLPRYAQSGTRYSYRVEEATVPGYTSKQTVVQNDENGGWSVTLTNTSLKHLPPGTPNDPNGPNQPGGSEDLMNSSNTRTSAEANMSGAGGSVQTSDGEFLAVYVILFLLAICGAILFWRRANIRRRVI